MNIVITKGNSCIGHNLVKFLANADHEITVASRNYDLNKYI